MSASIWSCKESLSDVVNEQLEHLSQHLNNSDRQQLKTDIEALLGTYIQAKKNQSNQNNLFLTKEKTHSTLTKTLQLKTELNDLLEEQGAEELKLFLLENDEDQWLKLKVLELDMPGHLDSLDEISSYLEMLTGLREQAGMDKIKQNNACDLFLSQLTILLRNYKINEIEVQLFYQLLIAQADAAYTKK
ncbi:MAG: hypothetical protein GY694_10725 [Gammaproteobacteria bacterium]|nr:hypothetical protein [Gammaproteobacteria bacterium]